MCHLINAILLTFSKIGQGQLLMKSKPGYFNQSETANVLNE